MVNILKKLKNLTTPIFLVGLIYRWGKGPKTKNICIIVTFSYTICEKIKKKFFLLFWLFGAKIWLFGVDRTFYQHFCNQMGLKKKKFFYFFWLFGVIMWLFGVEVTNQHTQQHSTTLNNTPQHSTTPAPHGTSRHLTAPRFEKCTIILLAVYTTFNNKISTSSWVWEKKRKTFATSKCMAEMPFTLDLTQIQ